jgi:cytidylate kinase
MVAAVASRPEIGGAMSQIEKILNRQFRMWETARLAAVGTPRARGSMPFHPTITISRQAGARGEEIAQALADRLGYSFFDQEIIDHIAAARDLRRRVLEMLDEHTVSGIKLWAESIVSGKYLDQTDFVRYLARTVRAIHSHGRAVILGRGANYLLADTAAFRVHIVAPLETRIRTFATERKVDPEAARREIEASDVARREFIHRSFGARWDDPAAYDLTLNTAGLPVETAVSMIEDSLRQVAAVRWPGAEIMHRVPAAL